jgi:peptide subunit release factor 1 (eRF1)
VLIEICGNVKNVILQCGFNMGDKVIIRCSECNYEWNQEPDSLSKIDWICPKCNKDDKTWIVSYEPEDKEFYNREVKTGRGGAFHA